MSLIYIIFIPTKFVWTTKYNIWSARRRQRKYKTRREKRASVFVLIVDLFFQIDKYGVNKKISHDMFIETISFVSHSQR